jgi:hypothetical protein
MTISVLAFCLSLFGAASFGACFGFLIATIIRAGRD